MTNETIIRILNWPKLPSIRPRNEVFRAPLKTSDKEEFAPLGYDSNPNFPQGPFFLFLRKYFISLPVFGMTLKHSDMLT